MSNITYTSSTGIEWEIIQMTVAQMPLQQEKVFDLLYCYYHDVCVILPADRPAESEDGKLFIGNLSYDVR